MKVTAGSREQKGTNYSFSIANASHSSAVPTSGRLKLNPSRDGGSPASAVVQVPRTPSLLLSPRRAPADTLQLSGMGPPPRPSQVEMPSIEGTDEGGGGRRGSLSFSVVIPKMKFLHRCQLGSGGGGKRRAASSIRRTLGDTTTR